MKNIIREWYSDPAHSWLKVKYSELVELGIQSKISPFSYRDGDDVYLEEDCDAPMYITAVNKILGHAVYFREAEHSNLSSHVRNFDSYFFTVEIPKGELIDGDSLDKEVA